VNRNPRLTRILTEQQHLNFSAIRHFALFLGMVLRLAHLQRSHGKFRYYVVTTQIFKNQYVMRN
jgi:hypothetical protein